MKFEAVADLTRGVPVMGEREGRKLYEHVRETKPSHVLEIGTAYGVSACFIAAALEENGHGRLTTVDHRDAAYRDPTADELFSASKLDGWIDRVRIADSSYTWWLKGQIEQRTDAAGNTDPLYDFCFLDGSHNWTIDGLAVVLVERLLMPGAWLLLDDLDWSYADSEETITLSPPSDKMFEMSPDELRTPHIGAIVDVILRSHPAFAEIRIQDGRWAWCRKDESATRRFSVETTRPVSVLVSLAMQRGVGRARTALRRVTSS
jgi:predicted O-methyltransferase YrrM